MDLNDWNTVVVVYIISVIVRCEFFFTLGSFLFTECVCVCTFLSRAKYYQDSGANKTINSADLCKIGSALKAYVTVYDLVIILLVPLFSVKVPAEIELKYPVCRDWTIESMP